MHTVTDQQAASSAHLPFQHRHIGSNAAEQQAMLATLEQSDLNQWIGQVIPQDLLLATPIALPHLPALTGLSEQEMYIRLEQLMAHNTVKRFLIGQGYAASILPAVIKRCVLEDPGWYTAYTPYQAEISQGRLEVLLFFQTLICELTQLPLANASLLDEATAAAEALHMTNHRHTAERSHWCFEEGVHPQTKAVVSTRAKALGVTLSTFSLQANQMPTADVTGILLQTPDTYGHYYDNQVLQPWLKKWQAQHQQVVVATDPIALCLLAPPGEIAADIIVGSSQRFGLPIWGGGPHAAYIACQERYKRLLPGRLIGVSVDRFGQTAYRMALQTREQHIRREKATSNICTAQALLAMVASFYAMYHGTSGLQRIAKHIYDCAHRLGETLQQAGWQLHTSSYVDTVVIAGTAEQIATAYQACEQAGFVLRQYSDGRLGITCDERSTQQECEQLLRLLVPLAPKASKQVALPHSNRSIPPTIRQSNWLKQPAFTQYQTEQQLTRYIQQLRQKDTSLIHSMIPLGSCTMKLNSATALETIGWQAIAEMHPCAPRPYQAGTYQMARELADWLAAFTGLPAVSLQPNAGSQGEFAGLLVIKQALQQQQQTQRKLCLIPTSAHGTNPASAKMAGLEVVPVACDKQGNIDLNHLQQLLLTKADQIAALMVTYPSTHGIFEATIRHVCHQVHHSGGFIYLDGANMNAQMGLMKPADYGIDVMHFNLHKTFSIPHGGGGPGIGPICARADWAPFLPQDPKLGSQANAVAGAHLGSAGILSIAWAYIAMMGSEGIGHATKTAILHANYMAKRLSPYFPILFQDAHGWIGHECILDIRKIKQETGIDAEDIAKRLMDFGFHAPTLSFPVPGTLMLEPTESESKQEMDKYCEAMIQIHKEIQNIASGRFDRENNPIRGAPHPLHLFLQDNWPYPYSRQQAGNPLPWVWQRKCWPSVGRIDNAYGDRNVHCTCDPMVPIATGA